MCVCVCVCLCVFEDAGKNLEEETIIKISKTLMCLVKHRK